MAYDRDRDRDRGDRDRDRDNDRDDDFRGGMGRYVRNNRRSCPFLKDGKCNIDYKDVDTLRRYVTEDGKIRPRRQTSVCSKCQRMLAIAVKRARHLALLPYAAQHVHRYGKD
jgi:small subunit ribosomal protein S18